ncbi:MAG: hypothetical protein WC073_14425 [Sterolibacterium sp.]
MSTPAVTGYFAQLEDAVACVLEAERAALAEIEHCKRQSLRLISDSRAHAELVHHRTEARIERLRQRMRETARLRQERIRGEMAALAGDMGTEDVSARATLERAIARIAEEIAGGSSPS